VGWGDTYEATVPGQHLNLTSVPDGRYALRSTADPDNLLVESNERNNDVIVYVEITGLALDVLDGP
jgi:subtilase family serine protease